MVAWCRLPSMPPPVRAQRTFDVSARFDHAGLMIGRPLPWTGSQNTSKWIKTALRAKGGAGVDDRKAISEQLRLGQELRAKVTTSQRSDVVATISPILL